MQSKFASRPVRMAKVAMSSESKWVSIISQIYLSHRRVWGAQREELENIHFATFVAKLCKITSHFCTAAGDRLNYIDQIGLSKNPFSVNCLSRLIQTLSIRFLQGLRWSNSSDVRESENSKMLQPRIITPQDHATPVAIKPGEMVDRAQVELVAAFPATTWLKQSSFFKSE